MGKDPAVLFYPNDFLGGVKYFSMEDRGKYITLLCDQFVSGHIPINHMISVCGSIDSPVIDKFIKDDDELYYNERMEIEKEKRVNYCGSRSNNKSGRKKGSKNKIIQKSYDNRKIVHMENENENIIKDINEFELFWEKYHSITGKPKSGKEPAKKHWKKLNKAEKNKAFENIQSYYDSMENKKYCQMARTYLSDKSFNDEFGTTEREVSLSEKYGIG